MSRSCTVNSLNFVHRSGYLYDGTSRKLSIRSHHHRTCWRWNVGSRIAAHPSSPKETWACMRSPSFIVLQLVFRVQSYGSPACCAMPTQSYLCALDLGGPGPPSRLFQKSENRVKARNRSHRYIAPKVIVYVHLTLVQRTPLTYQSCLG